MLTFKYENGSVYRKHAFESVQINLSPRTETANSFKEECIATACNLYKSNPEMHIALSGGIESQACLSFFIEAGFKPKILIIKFKDKANDYDVIPAMNTCMYYGIHPVIIEIMPTLLFDSKYKEIYEKYQTYDLFGFIVAYVAENLKHQMLLVDKINLRRDIHPLKKWSIVLNESDFWVQRFNEYNNAGIIINDFYKNNVNQVSSFLNNTDVREVTAPSKNKISLLSSKKMIFNNINTKGISNYKYTDPIYYLSRLKNSVTDAFFSETLFEDRKFYIPIEEYILSKDKTSWQFV